MRHRLRKMYTIHEKVLNELEKASSNYKISKSRIIENAEIFDFEMSVFIGGVGLFSIVAHNLGYIFNY